MVSFSWIFRTLSSLGNKPGPLQNHISFVSHAILGVALQVLMAPLSPGSDGASPLSKAPLLCLRFRLSFYQHRLQVRAPVRQGHPNKLHLTLVKLLTCQAPSLIYRAWEAPLRGCQQIVWTHAQCTEKTCKPFMPTSHLPHVCHAGDAVSHFTGQMPAPKATRGAKLKFMTW